MGSFDLGQAVRVTRVVAAGTPTAYRISQELLASYHRRGFAVHVRPCDEPELDHPSRLEGEFSKSDGTRVSAVVSLTPGVPVDGYRQTEVDVRLSGKVVVGGAKGMFATAPMVQKIAREKLEGYLDQVLAGVPPEAATPAQASAPQPEPERKPESEPAPTATENAEVVEPMASGTRTARLEHEADLARHDSEIARIEAEVLAAEAKLAEKQAEVEALEAEVAAEEASGRPPTTPPAPDTAPPQRAAPPPEPLPPDPSEPDPSDPEPVSDPLAAIGAFGTVAAEALVSATSDALAAAEALVDAGARVFSGQSESLTRETDLPAPEPLPPAEAPPAPEPLPSAERPPEPEPIPAPEAIPPANDLEERLAKVKSLFDKGLISEDEYRAKKSELLERHF
jgi:putative oligomerization/nucleic acid binding protein